MTLRCLTNVTLAEQTSTVREGRHWTIPRRSCRHWMGPSATSGTMHRSAHTCFPANSLSNVQPALVRRSCLMLEFSLLAAVMAFAMGTLLLQRSLRARGPTDRLPEWAIGDGSSSVVQYKRYPSPLRSSALRTTRSEHRHPPLRLMHPQPGACFGRQPAALNLQSISWSLATGHNMLRHMCPLLIACRNAHAVYLFAAVRTLWQHPRIALSLRSSTVPSGR